MLFVILFVPNTGAAPDPFVGAWTASDPVDGSQMRLAIGFGRGNYRINLFDDSASACNGDQVVVWGVGTASELELRSTMDVWCLAPMRYLAVIDMVFTYDP